MKTLLKLVVVLALLGVAVFGYFFWTGMTPGERYHIVDKARAGDVDGLADSVKYKAGIELERQKAKAKEATAGVVQEVSNAVVDETNKRIKESADAAADDAKRKIREETEAQLGVPGAAAEQIASE